MQIVRIGLDLAKYIFEVHGVDAKDEIVVRKTLRRDAVAQFFSELPPCLVGMEARSGAHYWAKVRSDLGHEVWLISPQFVTPYVKSNKSDRNDAEANCEAVGRPSMRFVPPKSSEQLEVQAIHRIRQRLVSDRTRLVNQIRCLSRTNEMCQRIGKIEGIGRSQRPRGCRRWGPDLLQERPPVCRLAGVGSPTKIQRR